MQSAPVGKQPSGKESVGESVTESVAESAGDEELELEHPKVVAKRTTAMRLMGDSV